MKLSPLVTSLLLLLLNLLPAAQSQDLPPEVVTVWPAEGLNGPDDERPLTYAAGELVYERASAAIASRRARRWLRRYGVERRDLRMARELIGGALEDAGEIDFLAEANGFRGGLALSVDSLQAYYSEAVPPRGARGRRAERNRRERLFLAERGPEHFNVGVELPGQGAESQSMHPALSPDGLILVFASDRPGGYGGLDLWSVTHDGDLLWGAAVNLGPSVNSVADDAYPSWHPDGTLYFASRRLDGHAVAEEADYDLFAATLSEAGGPEPARLGTPFNGEGDDVSIAFAPSGEGGYFASDRQGAGGGLDVYGFEFGAKLRLGPPQQLTIEVIDERTGAPLGGSRVHYVNAHGVTLAEALADSLVGPAGEILPERGALAAPTDSGRYELEVAPGSYYAQVARAGYDPLDTTFTVSTAPVDLTLPLRGTVPCVTVTLAVLDAMTLDPVVGAEIGIEAQSDRAHDRGRVVTLPSGGSVDVCLPCGDLYGLLASGSTATSRPSAVDLRGEDCGRLSERISLTMYVGSGDTPDDDPGRATVADVDPDRLEIDPWLAEAPTVIALPSVRYDYGSANLSREARSDLGHLAELMAANREMRVTLGSHTDAQSSRAFNAKLSGRRATEAARYLTEELGVDPARVRAVGYGESRLLNDCRDGVPCSAAEHAVNRRTEIAIIGVDDSDRIAEELSRRAAEAEAEGYVNAPAARVGRPSATVADAPRPTAIVVPAEYTPPRPRYRADYVADPGRPYWVIAGTFRRDANAERREALFTELGYGGVEVVRFDGSGRRAVVVDKFASLAEARQFSRAVVEAHRVAAYVKRVD